MFALQDVQWLVFKNVLYIREHTKHIQIVCNSLIFKTKLKRRKLR